MSPESYDLLKVAGDFLSNVIALGALLVSFLAIRYARRRDSHEDLSAFKRAAFKAIKEGDDESGAQLADHASRISRIESRLDTGPSREELRELSSDLHSVSDALSTLKGEFKGLRDLVDVSRRQTELIDQWLRSREGQR